MWQYNFSMLLDYVEQKEIVFTNYIKFTLFKMAVLCGLFDVN